MFFWTYRAIIQRVSYEYITVVVSSDGSRFRFSTRNFVSIYVYIRICATTKVYRVLLLYIFFFLLRTYYTGITTSAPAGRPTLYCSRVSFSVLRFSVRRFIRLTQSSSWSFERGGFFAPRHYTTAGGGTEKEGLADGVYMCMYISRTGRVINLDQRWLAGDGATFPRVSDDVFFTSSPRARVYVYIKNKRKTENYNNNV